MASVIVAKKNGRLECILRPVAKLICETCMGIQDTDDLAGKTFVLPDGSGMRASWLSKTSPTDSRRNFLAEHDGRKYVVKRTRYMNRERLLKRMIFGSISRNMIGPIEHAHENGFDSIQRTFYTTEFLTAVDGRRCVEIWIVADFVEGVVLNALPNRHDFCGKIALLLSEMAKHGVFQSDIHFGNFLLAHNGSLHGIDIRMTNSPRLMSVGRVAYKCKRALGVPLPTTDFTIPEKLAAFVGEKAFALFGKPKKLK